MLCVLLQANIDFTPGISHELYNTLCVSYNEEYMVGTNAEDQAAKIHSSTRH